MRRLRPIITPEGTAIAYDTLADEETWSKIFTM
jgi:hypothetical protein